MNLMEVSSTVIQLYVALTSTALIGAAGWLFSIRSRVATLEAEVRGVSTSLTEIKGDLRDLRKDIHEAFLEESRKKDQWISQNLMRDLKSRLGE